MIFFTEYLALFDPFLGFVRMPVLWAALVYVVITIVHTVAVFVFRIDCNYNYGTFTEQNVYVFFVIGYGSNHK